MEILKSKSYPLKNYIFALRRMSDIDASVYLMLLYWNCNNVRTTFI